MGRGVLNRLAHGHRVGYRRRQRPPSPFCNPALGRDAHRHAQGVVVPDRRRPGLPALGTDSGGKPGSPILTQCREQPDER